MLPYPVYAVLGIQLRVLSIVGELSNDGVIPPISILCFEVGSGEVILDGPEDPVPIEGWAPSISPFFWGLAWSLPSSLGFVLPTFKLSAFGFSEGILQFPERWQPGAGPRHVTLVASL